MSKLLFLYGTLKKSHCRSHLLDSQEFVSPVKTENNYAIFNCGKFPGIVHQPNSFVTGELWRIQDDYISYLDRIEGSPYLFKLEPIKIDGMKEEVFSYFWQKSTTELKNCSPTWPLEGEGNL